MLDREKKKTTGNRYFVYFLLDICDAIVIFFFLDQKRKRRKELNTNTHAVISIYPLKLFLFSVNIWLIDFSCFSSSNHPSEFFLFMLKDTRKKEEEEEEENPSHYRLTRCYVIKSKLYLQ